MYILCVRLRETTLYRLSLLSPFSGSGFLKRFLESNTHRQCCGSGSGSVGSVSFWASRIQILHYLFVRIRIRIWILPSSSKKSKKILISTVLCLLYDFLSLKNYVNIPSKSNKQRILERNLFLLASWKPPDENSRIRIRIHKSVIRIGSVPKCHGSTTLLTGLVVKEWF
jgi:hypothetical protein